MVDTAYRRTRRLSQMSDGLTDSTILTNQLRLLNAFKNAGSFFMTCKSMRTHSRLSPLAFLKVTGTSLSVTLPTSRLDLAAGAVQLFPCPSTLIDRAFGRFKTLPRSA